MPPESLVLIETQIASLFTQNAYLPSHQRSPPPRSPGRPDFPFLNNPISPDGQLLALRQGDTVRVIDLRLSEDEIALRRWATRRDPDRHTDEAKQFPKETQPYEFHAGLHPVADCACPPPWPAPATTPTPPSPCSARPCTPRRRIERCDGAAGRRFPWTRTRRKR